MTSPTTLPARLAILASCAALAGASYASVSPGSHLASMRMQTRATRRHTAPANRVPSGLRGLPPLPTQTVIAPAPTPGPARPTFTPTHPRLTPDTIVFDGQALAAAGIATSGWGAGSAADSTKLSYSGSHAIRIAAFGPYQGGRITFNTPISLGSGEPAAGRYLQFLIHFAPPDEQLSLIPATSGPHLAAFDGRAGLHLATEDSSGFVQLSQAPIRAVPLPPQNPGETGWLPPVDYLRFSFATADGAEYDILRPVLGIGYDETINLQSYWFPISIPVSAIKLPGPIQSVTIGASGSAAFYVGRIQVVADHSRIACAAGRPLDVAAGDNVVLRAYGDGGASTLHYSWDFDAADGIVEEASGPIVSHRFAKGGRTYTVTLTVTDADRIKPQAVSTIPIKVEE